MDKIVSVRAIETYMGIRCIAQHILNLGARWRRVVDSAALPLYSRQRTPGHDE